MPINYRKVQFKDLQMINLLENRYFDGFDPLFSVITSFIFDSRFSFICENNGRIVGVILCEFLNKKAQITTLCVEKEYSNLQIGKTLLNLCIENIKESNESNEEIEIELMVKEKNEIARRLYERIGFKMKEEVDEAYFDGSKGFVMNIIVNRIEQSNPH